jgi:hypothetical protein
MILPRLSTKPHVRRAACIRWVSSFHVRT